MHQTLILHYICFDFIYLTLLKCVEIFVHAYLEQKMMLDTVLEVIDEAITFKSYIQNFQAQYLATQVTKIIFWAEMRLDT